MKIYTNSFNVFQYLKSIVISLETGKHLKCSILPTNFKHMCKLKDFNMATINAEVSKALLFANISHYRSNKVQ